jgi:hypothetical protein
MCSDHQVEPLLRNLRDYIGLHTPVRNENGDIVDLQLQWWRTSIARSSSLTELHVENQLMEPASSHTVCFRFELPMSTPNGVAGKSSKVTMTIAAEQA